MDDAKPMKAALVVGTRPQIIKSASLILQFQKLRDLELVVVHTGQHYDSGLSGVFFDELGIAPPTINLEVGSGSQVWQTAEIMLRLGRALEGRNVKLIIIPGDTNSALGGALAATKMDLPVAHVEAGARSYDMTMAEEVNRRLIDHCSKLLFAPTENCLRNLKKESVVGTAFVTGDTMYDAFLRFSPAAERTDILRELGLKKGGYAVATLHRAENVDNPARLKAMIAAMSRSGIPVVLPLHPRTQKRLAEQNIVISKGLGLMLIEPIGYLEMLKLLKHARMALTDSGGLQKEAFWSKVPCITLRENTEWVETIERRVNFLVGTDDKKMLDTVKMVDDEHRDIKRRFKDSPFGDGHASERIVEIMQNSR